MKVFQASILFSTLLAVSACHSKGFQIQGSVQGLEDGDTLYLTRDMLTGMPSDTLIVKDGQFELSGETDSTALCMVYCASRNEINAPFFMEPGTINIQLTDQPGASRVGGTICNDQWQVLNDSVMVIGKEINRIAEHIYANNVPEEEQQKGMEQIERLNQRFAALVVKKAEANIDNEFGYFLLTYYPEELIDNSNRARLIKLLPAEMRQRPVIQQMEQMLQAAAKTAEGATIKDFTQKTLKGEELSLMAEVKKNRLTIIDFWASWCGPCRQEMPFMMNLYSSYQSKGLGIIGISLDSDYDAWLIATDKFGIKWPQMSDLKGWENEIAKHFNVTSIPHTIVVDQQGKILRRGLRGEQLEQFVQEQLK
jgi:thiol-disulfide isomerase/thioredoxin